MRGSDFAQLKAFVAVAQEKNFSRAAQALGVSPSALSQTIRTLEERLGVRLLNRTTRSVATTEAGERLRIRLRAAFDDMDDALAEMNTYRKTPAGTLRICAPQVAMLHFVQPMLASFHANYPDITLELTNDDSTEDIVARGFDAAIRLGEFIEQDMVALKLSSPLTQIAVASPEYVARHGAPQTPADLLAHRCVNWRRSGEIGLYKWRFYKEGTPFEISVKGSLVVNDCGVALKSALDGLGITVWIREWIGEELDQGRLIPLLEPWSAPFPGFYLCYPSNRQMPASLQAFIGALRAQA
ncbi:LysR family transcriptional regulator [Pseudomonas gingeri NCPPB 3146 = LMG 5327]|uniref:LysR family transcriptional regulator n=2 Tax=Pseudomonas gingeri TaxID=117681 RepID=A0A7Y8CBV6_9PSED|nr:LysR family transcriptional regulator [Pseudomonas gingeri]NWC12342.1 LysR family transcriptional regulator [Pseudomonas gingeri]NWE47692.1 LysR family transcriptional regulator [Pseudomonas gingeri]NWE69698.1 LysR family transcriptional regulator [Pseudomonas gingeri]PNQ88578.1 LysR family transcriptional regulator [Pseudomonas gingeri NCPPB 3146 = LMG 5327]